MRHAPGSIVAMRYVRVGHAGRWTQVRGMHQRMRRRRHHAWGRWVHAWWWWRWWWLGLLGSRWCLPLTRGLGGGLCAGRRLIVEAEDSLEGATGLVGRGV